MRWNLFFAAVTSSFMVLGGVSPAFTSDLGPAPVPDLLYATPESTSPIWASAPVSVGRDGKVRSKLFGDFAPGLQQELERPAQGCLGFETAHVDSILPPPRSTLDDAVKHSWTRILARVTNREFGIYSGFVPGQLLQVVPIETFGKALPEQHYYAFVPVGSFRLGDRTICKEDATYARPPAVGDEVFLFIAGPPLGIDGNLLMIYGPGDIVPVGPDGVLSLPRHYALRDGLTQKSQRAPSKEEMLDRLGREFRHEVWR